MSRPTTAFAPSGDRLLTFEVAGAVYALPIAAVLEVAEADRATCVPGLPAELVAVVNWQGDALPLVASGPLLAGSIPDEEDSASAGEADTDGVEPPDSAEEEAASILKGHVLVVSDRSVEAARMGMPVDRVLGLVDGRARPSRSEDVVVERRPVEGRVVSVLDPRRLVARAEKIIESAVA